MKKFSGYEEAEVKDFSESEKLEVGGHYCKILRVDMQTVTSKEGKSFDQLVLEFDLSERDKQAGFYQRKMAKAAEKDATKAKWKGVVRINAPTDDSTDEEKSRFKTFTTSIEKSNQGYKWNWEENTLIGKEFLGVFGAEEFKLPIDGKVITFVRCRFIRSTENDIEKISIPKVKLLSGDYVDYEEYMNKKANEMLGNSNENKNNNEFVNDADGSGDDLPF